MTEHTPGPWTAEKEGRGGITVKCDPLFDDAICRIVTAFAGAEANARLIAAAPDLFEACIEALGYVREHRAFLSAISRIEHLPSLARFENVLLKAVAKAVGAEGKP